MGVQAGAPNPQAWAPPGACGQERATPHPTHWVSLPSLHAGAVVARGEAKTQVSVVPGQGRMPRGGGRGRPGGQGPRSPGKLGSHGRQRVCTLWGMNPKPLR